LPWQSIVEIGQHSYDEQRRAAGQIVQCCAHNFKGLFQMAEGTIKKLTDKGFGFISIGGSKDLFFHSSSVNGATFAELREGQKVTYTEGRGPKGPCAENVTPV
jgi:CspA family cold shock protein